VRAVFGVEGRTEGCVQACWSSGRETTEPRPMRWAKAENAEGGAGCSDAHVSAAKNLAEDPLDARASFGGNDLSEDTVTDASRR